MWNVDFNTSMSHVIAGFPMIAICFSGFRDIIFRFYWFKVNSTCEGELKYFSFKRNETFCFENETDIEKSNMEVKSMFHIRLVWKLYI